MFNALFLVLTLSGQWAGSLHLPMNGQELPLVINIKDDSEATLDSPSQGAYGIPAELQYCSADSLSLSIPRLGVSYSARRVEEENGTQALEGTFVQMGVRLPLRLELREQPVQALRPQTPLPPFPYKEEEVRIEADGAVLAGTLVLPENPAPGAPAVVLVSGSGQQNRDEELTEHRPFAVISDRLARAGIASLRYDDRGAGDSSGDAASVTLQSNTEDARAVLNRLRTLGDFGPVGLLGHSEGGSIAYRLGGEPEGPDFIVSIAGPTVKGEEILLYQNRHALERAGVAAEQIEAMMPNIRQSLAVTPNPWLRSFIAYDPQTDLEAVAVRGIPVLMLFGEKDRQVPASMNLNVAERLLPQALIVSGESLNHLMQTAVTGEIEEYHEIEETVAPAILETIVNFITNNVSKQ